MSKRSYRSRKKGRVQIPLLGKDDPGLEFLVRESYLYKEAVAKIMELAARLNEERELNRRLSLVLLSRIEPSEPSGVVHAQIEIPEAQARPEERS